MSDYKYISSSGTVFDLCDRPIWVSSFNSMRSYGWDPVIENDIIFGFSGRKNVEKQLVIQCHERDAQSMFEIKERLYASFSDDVINNTPGRFYIGDYFIEGFVTSESVDRYDRRNGIFISTIPVFCKEEKWTCDVCSFVLTEQEEQKTEESFVFGFYPFRYTPNVKKSAINNPSTRPSAFVMTIFGPCTNPSVMIAGNSYAFSATVGAGERLIVDSRKKTVIQVSATGIVYNRLRSRMGDVFKRLNTGELSVSFENIPKIMLTVYDEREAPPWI